MGKIAQDLDTFRMPVDLKIETEGNPEEKRVEVVGTSSEFSVDTFGKPKSVVIDPNNRVLRYSPQVRVAVAIRRGEQYAELSEFGEAIKQYQKALETSRTSSLAHYRIAEVHFLQNNYQQAANEFREALAGDLDPKWTEVWSRINLGKIFDITGQRERAVNEYNLAIRTKDDTQGAQEEAGQIPQDALRTAEARRAVEAERPASPLRDLSRKSSNLSTTSSCPFPGRSSCFSNTQVCACGTNTAFSPASSAGFTSDFGLLPIIHVTAASIPRSATRRRYAAASFSFTIAVCWKNPPRPERSIFSFCSSTWPLVNSVRSCRPAR